MHDYYHLFRYQQNQMAEQNQWKKQMLANKNKFNQTKQESPVNNSPASTTPSWVKNNAPNTPALNNWAKNNSASENTATTPSTPAWMKNNSNVANQPPSPKVGIDLPKTNPVANTGASWAKKNQQPSPATSTASWAKPAQEQGNTASWAKNNSNSSPSQPAWGNKAANNASESPTASWANKNASSPSQPAWANKAASESPTNPPWMKKEDGGNQGNNSWKLKQMQDIEKQKKQREEKVKQLEEQEKEKKKQEKIRKQKQEEEQNIIRQLLEMAKEEQHSTKREKFEKEQIQRIEREKQEQRQNQQRQERERLQQLEKEKRQADERQQQRVRLEKERQRQLEREKQQQERLERQRVMELSKLDNSKSKSKSKKSKRTMQLQNSKISHISSIKGVQIQHSSSLNAFENMHSPTERDPSQPENLFHKYTRLMNEECSETDYRNKIAIQRLIIQTQLEFKRQSERQILTLIQKKKITSRKRKIVFSNNMQIRYGLCEGKKGENGLQFNKDEPQKLKNIFLYYEAITKCIVSLLKKKVNTHFRVPLLNLGEYKGITFLIEYICEELIDINEIDIGLFQEISNEVLILEKELELCYDSRNDYLKPLTKNQLMVKKVNIYDEDYYILYIKQESLEGKSKKLETTSSKSVSKIQPQMPNLTYIKLIEYITAQSYMLPFYNPPIMPIQNVPVLSDKIVSPATKNLLREITLANAIKTVYSSCQGEVQENIFFELIIGQSKQIWDMIKIAGFSEKLVPSPLVLSYLQKTASVKFNFTQHFYSKKQKQLIRSVSPSVYIQKHEFEMLQFIKNLDKYIAEDKEDLVEESMRMNKELWEEISKSTDVEQTPYLLQIKQQVSYLLFKQRDEEALEVLFKYQESVSNFAIEKIPISLLFIKIYVKTDAQIQLLKKLSELLQILQFYFKQETIIHSYVYTIVGSYYSKKQNDQQREAKVITFYEHAINIVLRLYGEKAQQVAEIYLSRANSMQNLQKLQAFQKDMNLAMKIYKMHSKNNSKLAECNYLLGKVSCIEGKISEGVELMQSSSSLFLKLQNYIESLNIYFEILHFLEGDEGKFEVQIEKIIEICFRYKSIWAFKKIITILLDRQLQCYTSLTIRTLYELFSGEEEERSNEEILIDLEEEIKGFTSFIEIVRWSLSILAAKVVIRKETTTDYWKALSIMKQVIHFYNRENGNETSPIKQSGLI